MTKAFPVALALSIVLGWAGHSNAQNRAGPQAGATQPAGLPLQETTVFAGSGVCARCHDGLLENQVDVSPVNLWRATMMANSAKDPLWLAKVSAEAAEFPDNAAAIQRKCIKCHAPMLYVERDPDYATADLDDTTDPLRRLWRDGGSCTVCHQIQPANFGEVGSFSGGFEILDLREIYGPYPAPFGQPMVNNSGFTPREAYPGSGWQIGDPEHCATCHNLYTSPLTDGTIMFPEQMPYYEWRNSVYAVEGSARYRSCQDCHMPATDTPIKISTAARNRIQARTPFWYHDFVGGNQFMLGVLQANSAELEVTATAAQFDEKLAQAAAMLADSVDLGVAAERIDSQLSVDVTLGNRAGHKLPTGIPLRRVWVHLRVTSGRGSVVFESGAWDATGEIVGLDEPYEPHHEIIERPDQVQVYETVLTDADQQVTRVLMHAAAYAKDNRIPPEGFTAGAGPIHESTAVAGLATADPDFNPDGSGADTTRYQIDLGATAGRLTVAVEVCYQAVTPAEARYLDGMDTAEANQFGRFYGAESNAPVMIATHAAEVR